MSLSGRAILLLVVLGLVPAPAFANEGATCTPQPLRILLTNDDGSTTPGIRSLLAALRAGGHDVILVAPAGNQSGTSAALTLGAVPVTQDPGDPAIYAVGGTPATSVLLGVTGILGLDRRPDLIVSGTNDGANLGPATVISGTVGATIVALQSLEPPIPAIAISTDRRVAGEPVTSAANVAHFEQVADFLARLVSRLQTEGCRKGDVLPEGLALNVNYPPLPVEEVQGVVMAEQGQASFFAIGYAQVAPGVFAPTFGALDPVDDVKNSDTAWFREGFVTVVPIDGNYTAPQGRSGSLRRALKHLEP